VTDSSPADPTVWEQVRHRLAQMQAARIRNVDPAALAEKLARRAKTLRSRTAGPETIGPRWDMLAFTSGRERYGIAVDEIIEVQPLDQFSLVPRAPAFILGVVHFRGAIVSLLDLGRLLNVPPSGLADLHVHIVVEAADRRIAVAATQAEEIFSISADQIKQAAESPGRTSPEWIAGVHDENRIVVRVEQLLKDPQLVDWRHEELSDLRRTGTGNIR
jgi:purine-binding chemotaxis protein CheW